jgi:hypothetical protein
MVIRCSKDIYLIFLWCFYAKNQPPALSFFLGAIPTGMSGYTLRAQRGAFKHPIGLTMDINRISFSYLYDVLRMLCMSITVVANTKGGVGKSTTAVQLSVGGAN